MGKGLTFVVIYAIVLLILFITFCVLITTVNPTVIYTDNENFKNNVTDNKTAYFLKVAFEDDNADVPIEDPNKETTDQIPCAQYTESSKQKDILRTLRRSQRDKDESTDQDGSEFVILKIVDADGKTKLEVQITPHCYRRKFTRLLDITLLGNDSNLIKNDLFSKSTIVKLLPNESLHIYEEEGFVKVAGTDQTRDLKSASVKDKFAMKPPFNSQPATSQYTKSVLQSKKAINNITFSDTYIPAFIHKNVSNPSKNNLSILKAMIVKKLNEKMYNKAKTAELASKIRKEHKKTTIDVVKFIKLFGDNDTLLDKLLNYTTKPEMAIHDNETKLLEPFDFMNDTNLGENNIGINKTALVEPSSYLNSTLFQNVINIKNLTHPKPKDIKKVEPKKFINSTTIIKFSNSKNGTDFVKPSTDYQNSTTLVKPISKNSTTFSKPTTFKNITTLVKNMVYNSVMNDGNNETDNLSVFDNDEDKDVVFDENYSTIDTLER